jgi:hypothetical protein
MDSAGESRLCSTASAVVSAGFGLKPSQAMEFNTETVWGTAKDQARIQWQGTTH